MANFTQALNLPEHGGEGKVINTGNRELDLQLGKLVRKPVFVVARYAQDTSKPEHHLLAIAVETVLTTMQCDTLTRATKALTEIDKNFTITNNQLFITIAKKATQQTREQCSAIIPQLFQSTDDNLDLGSAE